MKKIGFIILEAICLTMLSCFSAAAQEVEIVEVSGIRMFYDGKDFKQCMVLLTSFLEGKRGSELARKVEEMGDAYIHRQPLPHDPKAVYDELKKYSIGRRAWYEAKDLGNGYIAVATKYNSWGVIKVTGEFTIPLGTFTDWCSIDRDHRILSAWKPGEKCGIFTYEGKEISEFKYKSIQVSQLDNLAIALDHDYKNELLAPDENGFFRPISAQYTYMRNGLSFVDEEDNSYTVINVGDGEGHWGALNTQGKLAIPIIYTDFDRSDGRKFGRPAYVYMYWRGLREEGGKKYYDYYYARSFKLVHTEEITE